MCLCLRIRRSRLLAPRSPGTHTTHVTHMPHARTHTHTQAYHIFYSELGQSISFGNYWRDPAPHARELYLKHDAFLPVLDNDPDVTASVPTIAGTAAERKANFLKVKGWFVDSRLVVCVVTHMFAFFDQNQECVVKHSTELLLPSVIIGLRPRVSLAWPARSVGWLVSCCTLSPALR